MRSRTRRAVAVTVAAWLSASNVMAQTTTDSAIRARLAQIPSSYTTDHAFMGTVLLAEGDRILLSRGYGRADLEWDLSNAPDVRFRIGSLTKQFTSALILLLQQDGKLSITDPVSRYLSSAPPSWSGITLAQLLGHTSGIADFVDDPAFPAWSASPRTTAEELSFIEAKPLGFAPGTRFSYSNSNYEVLGAVIEGVTGRTYPEVLHQRILDPLGMRDTGLDVDDPVVPRHAQGYRLGKARGELRLSRCESLSMFRAAASLYSTTGDLLRWERGLFGGKVLTPASLRLMTTPGKGHYGLGLDIQAMDGTKVIWHNGGVEGFTSHLAYVPSRGLTAIALSNVGGWAPDLICTQMLDVAMGRTVVLPTERKVVPTPGAALGAYAGSYASGKTADFLVYPVGGRLVVRRTGDDERELSYEGMKGDHALFYVPSRFYEIEFIPGKDKAAGSITLHFAGKDVVAERREVR